MSAPILATKVVIPLPRPRLVHRRRLLDAIDASAPLRLTLVSAPAGFGKTTLVSEWAAGSGRPVAWLTLDEGDGDPRRFLAYVVSALRSVEAGLGASLLGRLQSPEPPPTDLALADLVNEVAQGRQDVTLVLDDYHLVDSKAVDGALAFLLDHGPPRMHLVIATREDPQLPLARLRSRGHLAELREADLRFTPAEAAEFLDEVMGLRLSDEDVEALESRTEGWIVGLQLAALSLQCVPDSAGFIRAFTGTHRFVLDYLLEEVLHRQPEPIQAFLLQTSILERLCGPLCDAVLPEAAIPAQDVLELLERTNLFTVPLDHERRWYRYHHLFAGLLRDRLARTRPDDVATLHRRASDWFARHGVPEAAVTHALAGQDPTRAADLIEEFRDEWPMRAGVATTLAWLESIPEEVRLERPGLGMTYAWTLFMDGQLDHAERFLARSMARVAADLDHLGDVFAIRLMIAANRRDMAAVVAMADEARSLIPTSAPTPRSRMLISLGVALSDIGGDLDGAQRAFREAYELGMAASPPSFVGSAPLPLTALAYLAEIAWLQGDLRAAWRMYEEARELGAQWGGQASIGLSLVQLGRASVLYEWDDLDGAALALEESIRIGESWSNARLLVPALGLSASVAQALGRPDEAAAAVHRAELLARDLSSSPLVQASVAVHRLALGLEEGDVRVVDRWHDDVHAESPSLPTRISGALTIAMAQAWLTRFRQHHEAADLERARALLEPGLARSQRDGLGLYILRLRILDALVLHEEGATTAALDSLAQTLEAAEPNGYLRSFLDLGDPAEAVIRLTLERRSLSEATATYVRRMLSRFRAASPLQPSPPRADQPVDALTEREMEVLRLVAAGLSNREIGERLFLALSTVKGHNRIIFDKLQVRRRTEAVARARELGFL